MSTCFADLLSALDEHSRGGELGVGDSALTLTHLATSLRHLDQHAFDHGYPGPFLKTVADHAAEVGRAWPQEPWRCAQLAGVIADAYSVYAAELNDADTNLSRLQLVTVARRCAVAIERNSAYSATLVTDLIGECDEYRRHAARHPIASRRSHWLYRPFALSRVPGGLAAPERFREASSVMADYMCMRGRNPLTARQIVAVTRASEVIAHRLERLTESPGLHQAERWTQLREQLLLVRDGLTEHDHAGNRRIMLAAATAHSAVEELTADDTTKPAVLGAASTLPLIASQLARELRRIRPTLFVPHGHRPLHDGRLREWFDGAKFLVLPSDLEPVEVLLDGLGRGPSARPTLASYASPDLK